MDRFHLMNVFVAVAEEQGFAATARRLHLSPPAVTRAVAALEQQLGIKLLNRTTRFVRVTEAGRRYLEDAKRILEDVKTADETAAGINAAPRGQLVITAPVLFGSMFVMPGIVDYLDAYPDTEVSAMFLDRIVNLLEEGVDVGIRIGELPDSSLRALRVGSVRAILCASPQYLQRNGLPRKPRDLLKHSIIASSAGNNAIDWRFDNVALRIQPRLTVTTNDAAIEAAHCGFGITRLLSYQVAQPLGEGKLTIVLENHEPPPLPIYIVHREGRFASARIRAFVDLMAKRLRADKALNQSV
jgi:DNA-binding transcriptional LysR family regulator